MTLNTETLQTGGATLGFAGQRLAEIGKGLWRAYWRRRSERATIAVLHALDDNVLRDIGLLLGRQTGIAITASPAPGTGALGP